MTKRKMGAAVVMAVGGATVSAILPAPGARASHGWDVLNDNSIHNIWRDSLASNANGGTSWGANNIDLTDLDVNETNQWSDVKVTDNEELGAYAGLVTCEDQGAGTDGLECRQWLLRFDNDQETALSVTEWKYLGCHEMGHTGAIGERGGEDSCMYPNLGDLVPLLQQHTFYDDHDKASINARIDSN